MIQTDDQDFIVVEPTAIPVAAFIREHADFNDIIHVYGDVDLSNSSELEVAISGLRSADRGVVVDLSNCLYMDSTALSVLVRAKKNLGHDFRTFVPPSGNVARLLEVTGLSGFLI